MMTTFPQARDTPLAGAPGAGGVLRGTAEHALTPGDEVLTGICHKLHWRRQTEHRPGNITGRMNVPGLFPA